MAHAESLLKIIDDAQRRQAARETQAHAEIWASLAHDVDHARTGIELAMAHARLTVHESIGLLRDSVRLEEDLTASLERRRRHQRI